MLANEPPKEVGVLVDLIRAHGELADWEQASAIHELALASARSLHDESAEIRVDMAWAELQARRGDGQWQDRISTIADRAIEHFSATGSEADLASALLLKAYTPTSASISESIAVLRQAHAHAENAGDERTQIETWDELGGSMIFGPTPYSETRDFMRAEVAWARERGVAFTEADGLLGEAYALAAEGNTDEARKAIAVVEELFAQLPGFVSQIGESDILAAQVEIEAGEFVAAESFYRRAIEALEKGEHSLWGRSAAMGLADLLFDLGRIEESRALLDRVDQRGLVWGARPQSRYLQGRARLAMADGDLDQALRLGREAIEALEGLGAVQNEARAHEVLGDLLAQAGDTRGATMEFAAARDLYAAKGYRPGEQRMIAKLGNDSR